jgi:hypothetical protein
VSEYDAEQLTAGFRSMSMLAALVQRGGRPAPVAPTITLRVGEKQYGWFPVTVDGATRRLAVITNQRLVLNGETLPLRSILRVRQELADWSVVLDRAGRAPVRLTGPWVPWMSVVICAELYGTASAPSVAVASVAVTSVPSPRRRPAVAVACRAGRDF